MDILGTFKSLVEEKGNKDSAMFALGEMLYEEYEIKEEAENVVRKLKRLLYLKREIETLREELDNYEYKPTISELKEAIKELK